MFTKGKEHVVIHVLVSMRSEIFTSVFLLRVSQLPLTWQGGTVSSKCFRELLAGLEGWKSGNVTMRMCARLTCDMATCAIVPKTCTLNACWRR